MMDDHAIDDLELLAYADGLLEADATRKSQVEERLSRCPALAERVRAYQAQTEALRKAYNARMYEAVPDRLRAALKCNAEPRIRGWARAAALALLVAASSVSGWLVGRNGRPNAFSSKAIRGMSNPPTVCRWRGTPRRSR
jgi:anti-sigma factor RsiW